MPGGRGAMLGQGHPTTIHYSFCTAQSELKWHERLVPSAGYAAARE